ncbi:MAG: selenocysteine-specific translation elongation factor [Actinomycetia bacterium]|nr:selenocysteine-specific translation elongation factor [Actinomycetes bacterium]MCP4085000.1 selenocysteine-specific translation elongation factor [Actinomycetes bacterium]
MHVIATAGHVDHGKSTLVRTLTGTDPDRFTEEKERGLTIDLGFAALDLPSGRKLSFIDVPGHIRFLKNMLAGVGAVDACVFVVAATESWMPQSEEHLRILQLLGVSHGVVALTKVGLADQELRELAELDLRERIEGSFLADAELVAVDSLTGEGVDELKAALDRLTDEVPDPLDRDRPRLWIDRAFAARGSGTVATGTLTGGSLTVGDELTVEPQGQEIRIRALQNHNQSVETIEPGNRVAVNLGGVAHDEVGRGDVLVRPQQWHRTTMIDAELTVLAGLDHEVSRRGAHLMYLGSGEHPVRMRILGDKPLEPGATGAVRLHLPRALPLLPGDRFVLREAGRDETVGGGIVLDIDPRVRAAHARPDRSIDRVVAERGWVRVDELERLTGERVEPQLGDWVVDPDALQQRTADVEARVEEAGPLGLDVAQLDDRERAVLETLERVKVEAGRATLGEAPDPFADHSLIGEIEAGGFMPEVPDGADRGVVRELVRRGLLVDCEGTIFGADAFAQAEGVVASLLAGNEQGATVAEIRDALGTTRKFVLPLLNHFDNTGRTRRRDDYRIAGPRLPPV